ncbi:MAG: cytochrome c [Pseudomonadota bacterium]
MSFVRAGLAVSAVLAAPTLMSTPYLATSTETSVQRRFDPNRFPQLGIAGMHIYNAQCAECHGDDGAGTEQGPSLHHKVYHASKLGQRGFHAAVSNGVAQQRWEFGAMPGAALSFNEIEQVARYVRDMQRGVRYR